MDSAAVQSVHPTTDGAPMNISGTATASTFHHQYSQLASCSGTATSVYGSGVLGSHSESVIASPRRGLESGEGGKGSQLSGDGAPIQLPQASDAPPIRPRACDSCRGLKVRCAATDPTNIYSQCRRCAKAHRECIFTPTARKRQKKTDSRVDELERKIEALTASLHANVEAHRGNSPTPTPSSTYGEDDDSMQDAASPQRKDTPSMRRNSMSWNHTPASVTHSQGFGQPGEGSCSRKRPREDDEANEDSQPSFTANGDSPLPAAPVSGDVAEKCPFTDPSGSTSSLLTPEENYQDVVDRGFLTMDQATEIFNCYLREMVPMYPAVVFPSNTTAAEIRKTRPTVFLAILAVASGKMGPSLHETLNREIIKQLAERVLVKGEKSLGLIQSLILCTAWYYAPNNNEELRFYQLVHMAAVMTMDMGINRRNGHLRRQAGGLGSIDTSTLPRSNVPATIWREHTVRNEKRAYPDSSAIESRRTLLATYWCCSSVSMSLRRPNIFRFTSYMEECIAVLETSEDALPSDRMLARWCKVQRIAEEIGVAFAFDDPGANVSIQDPRVQFALRGFRRQLEHFCNDAEECFKGVMGKSLQISYYTTILNAHEIALHVDHNVEDFGPPYTEKMIRGPFIGSSSVLSSFHIDLLSRCLTSAFSILDIFLALSIEEVRALPAFHFVRTIYASVILMKLFFSASAPKSELGHILDRDTLQVDTYVKNLVQKMTLAAGQEQCRSAAKFGMILTLLQSWWETQRADQAAARVATDSGGADRPKPIRSVESQGSTVPSERPPNELPMPKWSGAPQELPYSAGSRSASEAPRTPGLSQYKLPPFRYGAGVSSESPSTPPCTNSSGPTPPSEFGGSDSSNTPGSFRQNRPPPPLPPSFIPSTALQILSDIASRGAEGSKEQLPSLPPMMNGVIHNPQGFQSGQPQNTPSQPQLFQQQNPDKTQPKYLAIPHKPSHVHLPPPPEARAYYPVQCPGSVYTYAEGVFIPTSYPYTPGTGRTTYASAASMNPAVNGAGSEEGGGGGRGEGGGGGSGYYSQGPQAEGDAVGGDIEPDGRVEAGRVASWFADDLFWAVIDGLPASFDGGWGGMSMGGGVV